MEKSLKISKFNEGSSYFYIKKQKLFMRITLFFMLIVLALIANNLSAQWVTGQKVFGGSLEDGARAVQQTSDGGYIVAGQTWSFGAGNYDVYLIKTDDNGATLWSKTYGGTDTDLGYTVQPTTDGGYIVAGYTESFGAGVADVYLIKTNSIGDTLWTKTYGGVNWDEGCAVQQTNDGGYIVVGNTASFGAGFQDVYLIKTDAFGDTLWTKTYGGGSSDYGKAVQQTTDGGYIVAGHTNSFGAGFQDVYLIKTDALGDILWTRFYGAFNNDYGEAVQQTTDGGYIVAGQTQSFGAGVEDVYLIKTDANGNTLWTRTYGRGNGDDAGYAVQQTNDGGYIVAGRMNNFGGPNDVYLIKTDAIGDTLWIKTYGGDTTDVAFAVDQTNDGGYIVAGRTESFGAGGNDVYLIKTDANGNSGCNEMEITPWTSVSSGGTAGTPATVVGSGAIVNSTPTVVVSPFTMDSTLCEDLGLGCIGDTCVWPGDANSDMIANIWDLLPIGIGYATTGPVRASASLNWIGQPAFPWGDTLANGTDYMHVDCNGDGIIDINDVPAIVLNYGKVHLKTSNTTAGDPSLYFGILIDTVGVSTLVTVPIYFGDAGNQANNVYGLAFSINYDNTLVDSASVSFDFGTSWIGTKDVDMLGLFVDFPDNNGQVDVGMTRNDHNNVSGFGQIGTLSFITTDNISGKVAIAKILNLSFSDILVISNDETQIPAGSSPDSIVIYQSGLGIKDVTVLEKQVNIYPNPATDIVNISFGNVKIEELSIYNILGKVMYVSTEQKGNQLKVDTGNYPAGLYYVSVKTDHGMMVKKLVIQ